MKFTSIIAILAFAVTAAATEPTAAPTAPAAAPVKVAQADTKKEAAAPVSGDATAVPAKKGKKKAKK